MRSNLDDNKADKLDINSAKFGCERLVLSGNITLVEGMPFMLFFDTNGSNRDVVLPALKRGLAFIIENVGASHSLVVKTAAGATVATLTNVQGALFVCSGQEWKYLTNTIGDSLDPTEITSDDGTLTVTIVGGTVVNLVVNEAAVDHDLLLNFVGNKHIDHTAVTLTAGAGLSGGGDISASRSFALDVNDLTVVAPVLGDSFAFADLSDSNNTRKNTFTVLNGILDHDALLGFVANEHIDHSGVSITAGAGLTGGGTIESTRTISLDISGQSNAAIDPADEFIYWDVGGADFDKRTFAEMITDLSLLTTTVAAATYQPLDADLTAIAALSGTNNIYYRSAADTWTTVTFASSITFSGGQISGTAASETQVGSIEIATAAETTAGTDATRAVSPDGLAGSNYGKEVVSILVFDDSQNNAVADGAGDVFWRVPSKCNGWNLVEVAAHVQTAGTTGTVTIQIHNVTQAADMLSTRITIDSTEKDSATAATPAVIDTGNDDVATGDEIRVDVDAIHTTPAKGLLVELTFQLP